LRESGGTLASAENRVKPIFSLDPANAGLTPGRNPGRIGNLNHVKIGRPARCEMKKQAGMFAVAGATFVLGMATVQLLPRVDGQEVNVKEPVWQRGMSVMVRKPAEQVFSKDSKRVVIEVYKDANNGNLIYVSEAGSIAVVPAK
jgi:hypothetical protein